MADKQTAKFSLNFESNAKSVAEGDADALVRLQQNIQGSQTAIKEMSSAMGRLKGSTDAIKKSKEELAAKIRAERDAVSSAQLALTKAGTTYEAVAKKAKILAEQQAKAAKKQQDQHTATSSTLQRIGGPLSDAKGKFDALKEAVTGASSAGGAATLAIAGLTAAAVALAASVAGAGIELAKWIIGGANAARTANLFREAALGTSKDASRLGDQLALLSTKVSTPRAELDKLALSLARQRISGKAAVDTLNLVAQASDAMGDSVGSRLEGIVTRGKLFGRFGLNPRELLETGIAFKDVAQELATNLHIGLGQAQTELLNGRVKLEDGAKALRGAVEKRFGALNARKMLDLGVQAEKFKSELVGLTKDVDLEPLVGAVGKFHELFSANTVTGRALKELITGFGNAAVKVFTAALPYVKTFFQGLIIGALEAEIAYLKVRNALNKTFGDRGAFKDIDWLKITLQSTVAAAEIFGYTLLGIYTAIRLIGVAVENAMKPWKDLVDAFTTSKKQLGEGWEATGKAIVHGLIVGLETGVTQIGDQMRALASTGKDAFKSALGIHSPSKVFAQYGEHTAEGYAQGVESGSSRASGATAAMVQMPQPRGGRGSAGPVSVHLEVHVHGGGEHAQETAKTAASAMRGLLPELTRILEEHALSTGVPLGV